MVAFLWILKMDVVCFGDARLSVETHAFFIWQVLGPGSKMMGLGNGRRSMKSPPLILAALVACVIVLGFNYWIASSRSVELQVCCVFRVYEPLSVQTS